MSALCCPFTQNIPTTVGANFTLDLGPICNGKPSSNYGFTSYNLDFQLVEKVFLGGTYRINAANPASTSLFFTAKGCPNPNTPICPSTTVENAVITVTVSAYDVTVKSKTNAATGTKAGLSWNFKLFTGNITGTLCPGALNLEGSTPTETVPPNPDYASVFGVVRGTPDANQICQSNFVVTYPHAKDR